MITDIHNLTNKILISMPNVEDTQFERSVVYIFDHNPLGAVGFIVNQPSKKLTLNSLRKRLNLNFTEQGQALRVLNAGPIDRNISFLLHLSAYQHPKTILSRCKKIGLTKTNYLLRSMPKRDLPNPSLLLRGYARWEEGQLEEELQNNIWLTADCDPKLIFHTNPTEKFNKAMMNIGVDYQKLSYTYGEA